MVWNGTATKWLQFILTLVVIIVAAAVAFGSLSGDVKRLDTCVEHIEKVNLRQFSEIKTELKLMREKVDKTHDEVIELKTIVKLMSKEQFNGKRVTKNKEYPLPAEKTVRAGDNVYSKHR